jgi:hypothetical protein
MPPIEAHKAFDLPAAINVFFNDQERGTGSQGQGNPPRFEFEEEFLPEVGTTLLATSL